MGRRSHGGWASGRRYTRLGMPSTRVSDPTGPGHLDHHRLTRLLGYQLAQASIPTNRLFKSNIEAHCQLNKLEFSLLMLVASNEHVTPKRLSVAMNVPGPNLTLLLGRLEERGLLQRERSETDRRVQHLRLTSSGEALVQKLDTIIDRMEADLLSHLSPGERTLLFELLAKVAAHRKV